MEPKSNGSSTIEGEKVSRGDNRLVLADLIHRCVVSRLDANQQLRRYEPRCRAAENLPQHGWSYLATAASTVAELGQAQRGTIGCVH